jgi:hypothetical protein
MYMSLKAQLLGISMRKHDLCAPAFVEIQVYTVYVNTFFIQDAYYCEIIHKSRFFSI